MADTRVETMRKAHKVIQSFAYEQVELDKGYANRTLRVDLSVPRVSIQPVSQQMKDLWTGGKGFDLWLTFNEINRNTTWDSPENPICMSSGPLGGTCSFPGSGKTLVTTISPMTNIIIDCNVGGYFGPFLKFSGFDALTVIGKAKQEVIVVINAVEKIITIEEAPLESVDSHVLAEELTEMYADDELDKKHIAVVSAGRAADHARMGVLNFSFWDWRRGCTRLKQAGRGGIGTVFRNKKIKALVLKNRGITPAWRIEENRVARLVTPKTVPRQTCAREQEEIRAVIEKWGAAPANIVPMLIDIQQRFRHVSKTAMDLLVKLAGVPLAKIYHIVTFYDGFSLERSGETTIQVCTGSACLAKGAGLVLEAFERELQIKAGETTTDKKFTLRSASCLGACDRAPVVKINDTIIGRVKAADVQELLRSGPKAGVETAKAPIKCAGIQEPIVMRTVSSDFAALKKTLADPDPDRIISLLKQSGLRGRGGGGFSAADKWEACRSAFLCSRREAVLVCNAAIVEPPAYAVIEGMLIAALATGATSGHVCFRHEHAEAKQRFEAAVEEARKKGVLGNNIAGSSLSFDLRVHRGPGGFVVGESSALLNALSGNVGEPLPKYIHRAEQGLGGRPTLVHNIETWATIPFIFENGAGTFAAVGSGSKGTKLISLQGDCYYSGLAEAALGTSLQTIIDQVGNGVAVKKRSLKAVQVGGPSGGFLPAAALDLPFDYDTLKKAGAMMGSGAITVKDNRKCIVDSVRSSLQFLLSESCGKCTPCREGCNAAYAILTRICNGDGMPDDLTLLEETAHTMADASLCQFGRTAANPLLSSLRYFKNEYEEHIHHKKCAAGVCKALVVYAINDRCTGCTLCAKNCPVGAISGQRKSRHVIDSGQCIKCGICYDSCNFDAVEVRPCQR
ncbi:MAG: NAD(P)H-dependent oxidoreductase subunit E [Chitinispirillaceae bacterium]|nr:NAD(P)H-dependent oxidoreductase subunit E [Chitinispirillaceae bacterium]